MNKIRKSRSLNNALRKSMALRVDIGTIYNEKLMQLIGVNGDDIGMENSSQL